MSRGAQIFKQGDIAKALKAAANAGVEVQRFEIDPTTGKIVVYAGKPAEPEMVEPANEWDAVQ
jgi:nucleotide-binding universal stress UspA family protein